jgi:CheY-like chemotaxis protein
VRQTVLVVLEDADARQQALSAMRETTDLLPAAARSLKHALEVLDEMRVDLLLLDGASPSSADVTEKLEGVAVVRLTNEPFESAALLESVRAAIPPRSPRRFRPAS